MLRPTRWFYPPNGELSDFEKDPLSIKLEVDTFEGKVHVEWAPGASVTAISPLTLGIIDGNQLIGNCWLITSPAFTSLHPNIKELRPQSPIACAKSHQRQ